MFLMDEMTKRWRLRKTLLASLQRKIWTAACCVSVVGGGQKTSCAQNLDSQRRPTVTLTLPAAVQMAMQHNRHLQVARLEVAGTEQKRNLARADYFPHIKNESTALHVTELEGIVIPAGAFAHGGTAGLVPSDTVRVGQGGADTFTSGTGLVQPITQLLRVHAAVKAAHMDIDISRLHAAEAENMIALEVHKIYYGILVRQMQLAASREGIKASTVMDQETIQAVSDGHSLELAKLESHATLLEGKQSELTQELDLDDLVMKFDDVLGLPLGTRLELDASQLGESPALPAEEEAIALLKDHSQKVLEAWATLDKARVAVTAAKESYIPDVSGLARYSYQSGVPFLAHNFGVFGGVISYELFDGGAREAKLGRARIEQHIAEIELAQTEADVAVEMASVYDQISKFEHLLAVATEVVAVREEAARVSQARVLQDAALGSELARADAGVATARASVLEVKLSLFLARNQVKQLLGQLPN